MIYLPLHFVGAPAARPRTALRGRIEFLGSVTPFPWCMDVSKLGSNPYAHGGQTP